MLVHVSAQVSQNYGVQTGQLSVSYHTDLASLFGRGGAENVGVENVHVGGDGALRDKCT